MTMQEIVRDNPEWTPRMQLEAWLTALARDAGEHANFTLAQYGASLDDTGNVDISHMPDADVEAIRDTLMS